MHETASSVGAGWYPDSAQPTRTRWWDGECWTARVMDNGDETIAWAVSIVDQPPPMVSMVDGELVIDLTGVGEVDDHPVEIEDSRIDGGHGEPTENIVLLYGGAPGVHTPSRFVAPAPQSNVPIVRLHPARHFPTTELRAPAALQQDIVAQLHPRRSTRRRLVAVAAAAAIVLGAAAGAAVILDASSSSGETQPLGTRTYRDAHAGFELQYPRSWRVHDPDSGTGVQFAVGGIATDPANGNTVTVTVGNEAAELPLLNDLADDLTEQYRVEHPTITLDSGTRTKLAGAQALRIRLSDVAGPGLHIEQYVGTTAGGRSLTVTVSVADPRTAPTGRLVRGFVRSIQSV